MLQHCPHFYSPSTQENLDTTGVLFQAKIVKMVRRWVKSPWLDLHSHLPRIQLHRKHFHQLQPKLIPLQDKWKKITLSVIQSSTALYTHCSCGSWPRLRRKSLTLWRMCCSLRKGFQKEWVGGSGTEDRNRYGEKVAFRIDAGSGFLQRANQIGLLGNGKKKKEPRDRLRIPIFLHVILDGTTFFILLLSIALTWCCQRMLCCNWPKLSSRRTLSHDTYPHAIALLVVILGRGACRPNGNF